MIKHMNSVQRVLVAGLLAVSTVAVPMLAGSPAMAQGITGSALKGLDSRAPIDVDADRIDVLDQQNQAIFAGNVRVRQANLTLNADGIKIAYARVGKGDPEIRRLDADGNVELITPSERATARFGIYDVQKRILTLVGNVKLNQGTTKVNGNRLTIDLNTGRSTMDGKSSTGQSGSRVSGRFSVPSRN